jgi:hypothetical protein
MSAVEDPEYDPNVHTIYMGRQVRQARYEDIRDNEEVREAVEILESAINANQLRYYVPPCQSAVDFLNDSENDVKMVVAPNGVGKTCLALIDIILDGIPNDPEWELFKVEGVKPRVWMGPKKIAICTYKMQLHKRHVWPELQKWVPHDQLADFRPAPDGQANIKSFKSPSWDRDPHVRLKCGTKIYFMAYEQDQDVFESFACDMFLWDEQGVEAKFDGADERVRRRSGRHVFSLTPHKVEGRPDTGHGSWIHKMVTGENPKGHNVAAYSMSIEDALERYYPARRKREAYTKWIEIPTKNKDMKTLREGRARYYGEWHTTAGLVLDEIVPDIHFIDPFEIDNKYTLFRAVDHGTRNPTACLWFAVDQRGFIYCYREYYSVGKTIGENVSNIIEFSGNRREKLSMEFSEAIGGLEIPRFEEVPDRESFAKTVLDSRSFSTMDPQSGRPTGWVYKACGLLCRKASGKTDEYRIPLVKELLRINPDLQNPITGEMGSPRMFFFNNLVHFQKEWQGYVWEDYRSGGDQKNMKEHGRQKDNHLITALFYAAQIPMRYLGNYVQGDHLLHEGKENGITERYTAAREAISSVTGY